MFGSASDVVALRASHGLLLAAALFLVTSPCRAQDEQGTWKLSLARHDDYEYFGMSISLDRSMEAGERRLLIGAPTYDRSARGGTAHIYRLDGGEWVREQELAPKGDRVEESYGSDVSLCGDTALVGAYESRVVYVYAFDGADWIQQATLRPNEAFDRSRYYWGFAVSLWDDCALVGGYGTVSVFRREGENWREEAELGPSGWGHQQFGSSVSLGDRTALVGAPEGYDIFPGKGRVYVFRYDGSRWTKEEVLRAPDGSSGARFGGSVSLDRDACLIGATYCPSSEESGRGAAYVFRRDGKQWALDQELRQTKGSPDDDVGDFGSSTSLCGDRAVVGVPYYGPHNLGTAYVYERSGDEWAQVCRLTASDLEPRDHFGWAVSMGRGFVAVGAPNNQGGGTCYGAVYVSEIPARD